MNDDLEAKIAFDAAWEDDEPGQCPACSGPLDAGNRCPVCEPEHYSEQDSLRRDVGMLLAEVERLKAVSRMPDDHRFRQLERHIRVIEFGSLPGVGLIEWMNDSYIPFRFTGPLGAIAPFEGPVHNTVRCFYSRETARRFLEEAIAEQS